MEPVEMRWVTEPVKPHHKTMELQYRVYRDVGGPYPNYQWSEWMPVPIIKKPE
jgi:hypothetical protein